jgi:hypothetical protein
MRLNLSQCKMRQVSARAAPAQSESNIANQKRRTTKPLVLAKQALP